LIFDIIISDKIYKYCFHKYCYICDNNYHIPSTNIIYQIWFTKCFKISCVNQFQLYLFTQVHSYLYISFYLTAFIHHLIMVYNGVLLHVIIKYQTICRNGLVPNSWMWISMFVVCVRWKENEFRPSSPNTRKYDSGTYGHCKSPWWIYALLTFIVVEFTLRGNAARAHCSRKRRRASLSGQYGLTGRAALGLIIS